MRHASICCSHLCTHDERRTKYIRLNMRATYSSHGRLMLKNVPEWSLKSYMIHKRDVCAWMRARLHAFHTCKRNLCWSDLRWHIHNATRSIGRHPVREHSVKMLQRNDYNSISWDHIHGPHNICRLWVKLPQGNNAICFVKICTTHTHCYQQVP